MPDTDHASSGAQNQSAPVADRAGGTYTDQLESTLARKEQQLNEELLPKLKEEFHRLHSSFRSLYHAFVQKALVAEDPYKYDQKISDVTLPSKDPILESEQSDEIGMRLSQYDSQLEFLNTYYSFSIDFLTLKRIKLLAALAKYINWGSLSDTSSQPNTRAVAVLFGKIRGGADHFSSQIITDSQKQLAEGVNRIMGHLKELTNYHRESYKLAVRRQIAPRLDLPASIDEADVDRIISQFRRATGSGGVDLPFYQELVKEVVVEDLTPAGGRLREEALAGLGVREKKQKQQVKESLKPALLESVRILASASRHIETALDKLNANALIYEEQKSKSGGPLVRWFQKLLYGEKHERIYEVEFVDIATSVSRTERIDFDKFLEESTGFARVLSALSNKMSPRYARMESATEEEIYAALEQLVVQNQKVLKTIPAIQEFLSSELPHELRAKLRGIKLELNGIQNAVVKANQKRHDYVSRKEEEDQLKRLGVADATT
jgi:hypothetical protein